MQLFMQVINNWCIHKIGFWVYQNYIINNERVTTENLMRDLGIMFMSHIDSLVLSASETLDPIIASNKDFRNIKMPQ